MTQAYDSLQHDIKQALGWTECVLRRLPGATSAEVLRAEHGAERCVIKLFDPTRWERSVDELSRREAVILEALAGSAIPAPRLLAILPHRGIIMSACPGAVRLPSTAVPEWLRIQAEMLTAIHRLTITVPFRYESWNDMRDRPAPRWWPDAGLWEAARQRLTDEPGYPTSFIHRDYHPLNLLWEEQRISGIVDWTNAGMGPAGVDVAHCRLNLTLLYGGRAADDFLDLYKALNPDWRYDSYWDLEDAFSTLPDPGVYSPWHAFGRTELTDAVIRSRLLTFVQDALSRDELAGAT